MKCSGAVWPPYPVLPGCTPVYWGKCLKCRYLPRYYRGQDFFVKKWSKVAEKWSKWSKIEEKNCQKWYYTGIYPGIFGIFWTPVFLNWPLATLQCSPSPPLLLLPLLLLSNPPSPSTSRTSASGTTWTSVGPRGSTARGARWAGGWAGW